ncbi:hypothetical protein AAHA92_04225 [Salvia divinorum]|uniref:Uncharacterized protein n=1 Tax=Salvia divinorum TaxID=28513 RepID=A0ABD1I1S1_SALDI
MVIQNDIVAHNSILTGVDFSILIFKVYTLLVCPNTNLMRLSEKMDDWELSSEEMEMSISNQSCAAVSSRSHLNNDKLLVGAFHNIPRANWNAKQRVLTVNFFCVMKEGNPSKHRASVLKFFDSLVLPISGFWNTVMAHPNDPEALNFRMHDSTHLEGP